MSFTEDNKSSDSDSDQESTNSNRESIGGSCTESDSTSCSKNEHVNGGYDDDYTYVEGGLSELFSIYGGDIDLINQDDIDKLGGDPNEDPIIEKSFELLYSKKKRNPRSKIVSNNKSDSDEETSDPEKKQLSDSDDDTPDPKKKQLSDSDDDTPDPEKKQLSDLQDKLNQTNTNPADIELKILNNNNKQSDLSDTEHSSIMEKTSDKSDISDDELSIMEKTSDKSDVSDDDHIQVVSKTSDRRDNITNNIVI